MAILEKLRDPGLGFPEILNPKKIPQIFWENLAILEIFQESANSESKFNSFQKSKSLLSKINLYFRSALVNVPLAGNKDSHANYYLQGRLELRDCEEATSVNDYTQNLHWNLTVSSNDTIAIVRDTQKEDAERALVKSWEDKEPGRVENAKNSREVFVLKTKKRNGEELTEEEVERISQPRVNKRKLDAENLAQGKGGGKGAPAKGGKPAGKAPAQAKKEVVVEKVEESVKKPFPRSQEHIMVELCAFLNHLESDRTLFEDLPDGKKVWVRTPEENEKVRELSCLSVIFSR